jgi:hypothetical protein
MPPKTRSSSIKDASKAKANEEEALEAIRAAKLARMVAEKKAKASEKKTQETDRAAQEAADLVKRTLALSVSETTATVPPTATMPSATGKTMLPFPYFIHFFLFENLREILLTSKS